MIMSNSPFRPLLVAVLALSSTLALAGCQTTTVGGASAQVQSAAPPATRPARGPFVAAANPLAVEAGL